VYRNVYFPTLSDIKGDTGVVDLQALTRGEPVIFKIPHNRDWLVKHGWILPHEEGIPYIKSLKLFLPKSSYTEADYTTTAITLTSTSGSSVSLVNPNTDRAFYLPEKQNTYQTLYEEGEKHILRLKGRRVLILTRIRSAHLSGKAIIRKLLDKVISVKY